MQAHSGWFSMWPGGYEPWNWGTIYSTHFLVEAQAAGYPVPEDELALVLNYLRGVVATRRDTETMTQTLERAYGLYVLALAKKPDLALMDALREEAMGKTEKNKTEKNKTEKKLMPVGLAESFPTSAKAFLAVAYLVLGKKEPALALLGEKSPAVSEALDTGGVLRSPARETAILLSAYLDLDPASPEVPALVERLKRYRVECRWGSTQENAFALLALGKYARKLASTPREFSAEIRIGDAPPVCMAYGDRRAFSGKSLSGPARISLQGPGTLFYSWIVEGVPTDGPVEEVDAGIVVRRRYLGKRGEPLDPLAIPCGEPLVVELSLATDQYVANVVVTDLLPAGIEVENPDLSGAEARAATVVKVKPGESDFIAPAYLSCRDDRAIFFFNLSPGKWRHRYACRAVTRGDFQLPPVQAEAMYNAALRSISGAGRIVVK